LWTSSRDSSPASELPTGISWIQIETRISKIQRRTRIPKISDAEMLPHPYIRDADLYRQFFKYLEQLEDPVRIWTPGAEVKLNI